MPNQSSVGTLLMNVALQWDRATEAFEEFVPDIEAALETSLPEVRQELQKLKDSVVRLKREAQQPTVVLATTGTTSSGKSTIANVLVGDALLPKAVQEMSAGVVTIEHDQIRRLKVTDTKNAKWETGEWTDLSAEEIQDRLAKLMEAYRNALDGLAPHECEEIEPPSCTVQWPTRLGLNADAFGLPKGCKIRILDLPGLKYVDDNLNGDVVKREAKGAMCIVAYNSYETDANKQAALLNQVVDQVKVLGGSPARMMFILNRIDAFLTDPNPEESEKVFTHRVTHAVQSKLREALPEYADEIKKILPLGFSSEPALMTLMADNPNSSAESQETAISNLDKHYNALFPREFLNELPRSASRFSAQEKKEFVQIGSKGARLDRFEATLRDHIAKNLPELLLPHLVQEASEPARNVLRFLDTRISTFKLLREQEVEDAQQRLEEINQQLMASQAEVLGLVGPLRDLPEDEDLQIHLVNAGEILSSGLGLNAAPLWSVFHDIVKQPLDRLMAYTWESGTQEGGHDELLDGIGGKELQKSLRNLMAGPYGAISQTGGKIEDSQAEQTKKDLNAFSRALTNTANRLLVRESEIQGKRLENLLQEIETKIAEQLGKNANEILAANGHQFKGLGDLFHRQFSIPKLQIQRIHFEPDIERWSETLKEVNIVKQQRWKYIPFFTKSVVVTIEKSASGMKFGSYESILASFGGSFETSNLEDSVREWLVESIKGFDHELESTLEAGVNEYRRQLQDRLKELKKGVQVKVRIVESHEKGIDKLRQRVQDGEDWRKLK
ncbi:hypothetical protein FRD01_22595 [Microvenator marinus]|uniref:Dynamin N-terminal domain-containing protein n=1 Tax=Microvenator marinus TaxID=2600177 RepID=A0A5B8XVN0_9DELT|nr:dynamin family protein [Microvenator marinus]QED29972.1 hypothetical protein FRD01_22595 [Microvenator marinus]